MPRIRSSCASSTIDARYFFLLIPIPCSPLMQPPNSVVSSKSSFSASGRFLSHSSWGRSPLMKVTWTFPSPAWPKAIISSPRFFAISSERFINLGMFAIGTETSSILCTGLIAANASAIDFLAFHSLSLVFRLSATKASRPPASIAASPSLT